MKHLALAFAGLLIATPAAAGGSGATYTVTFDGTWSAATHPKDYPSGAHFSGLIGATHDSRYVLFREEGTATDGLERLAEKGAHSPLDQEIRSAIGEGSAGTLLESGPIFDPPGSASITFAIDEAHPMVSLVAMIAPSPDWFAGVANVDLRENGGWVARKELIVYAWDAGTDDGTTYAADDADAQPRGAVSANGSPHFLAGGKMNPVGKLVFQKNAETRQQTSSN